MNIEQTAREAQRQVIGEDIGGKQWLERFAALVRAQALEEAAAVCDSEPERQDGDMRWICDAISCGNAIRALKASPDAEGK